MILTKQEALVLSAYTGIMFVQEFSDLHEFIEYKLDRPVWTHELAKEGVVEEIKEAVYEEAMKIFSTVCIVEE